MLAPEEFTVGSFAAAPLGSLVIPRTRYEFLVMVGALQDVPTAVFLGEDHQFQGMSTEGAQIGGLIIPNVSIEVDEFSAVSTGHGSAPLGTMVRSGSHLGILAKPDRARWGVEVTLVSNLPDLGSESVGFTSWQVVLGIGDRRRVLHKVQLAKES